VNTTYGNPYGVAADGRGDVYAAIAGYGQIAHYIWTGADGSWAFYRQRFVDPYGVAVSLDGQFIFVADAGGKSVWELRPNGSAHQIDTFADPYGVAVDSGGNVYVADPGSKHVWKLTP
jgi:sugar lactone lactonase YvrE